MKKGGTVRVLTYLPLAGGVGLFLYGITLLGESLERAAGAKLSRLLRRMTRGRWRPMLLGLCVTAVIQSSTAATVMTIGLVNGGILGLEQAAGIIFGANIGTTATAWLLSLSELSGGGALMELLKPSGLAPILLLVGGLAYLLGGERSGAKARALLPLGFGLLFLGMGMMEQALLPLSERADFRALFMRCDSLPTGILAGALVTALIQSSSASVGMLQALASTGMVPFSTAVPIIMGQNIGTCVTVLLASVGSGLNARRAAMVHFYFNLFGTIAFCALIYGEKATVGIPFWGEAVTRSGISLFHTLFNVVNTLWMMPLLDRLLRLVERTVGGRRAAGLAGSRTA